MSFLRQLLLCLAVLAGALFVWITYVPAALPWLERTGLPSLLGITLPAPAPEAANGGRRSGGAAQVVVAEVSERRIDDRITAIGDARAQRAVTVRAEAVGMITEITLDAGSRVEQGAVIARLEAEAETIALERARIMLEDARDDANRVTQLENTGAITEVRIREARLALRTAELALREAEFDLSQRTITAPISGWVGILDIEVGDRVLAQDVLATITDRSSILIDFRVPERVIGDIAIGLTFDVTPLGLRDTVLEGRISAIDTVVDRASRTLRVQGRVDNSEDRLRVGMAFSVALTFPGEALLAIEPLALQWSSDGAFVWAVRDGKAVQVPVTIRQRNSDSVLVEADLKPGEKVVTEGVQTLRPGAEVGIANEADAAQTTDRLPTKA